MRTIKTVVMLFPSLAFAATTPWVIEPAQAQAKFTVRHMMISDVTGTLGKVTGTVDVDEKDLTKSVVDVSIAVEPNTQEEKRDKHLKSPDFFDVDRFPTAKFKSKKIAKAGKDKFKVTGDLTLRDVTKETVFEVTLTPPMEHAFTKLPVRGVVATGKINRQDYGLTWQVPMANNGLLVGNDVKIELNAELGQKPAEAEKPAEPAKDAKDAGAAPAAKPDAGPAPKK